MSILEKEIIAFLRKDVSIGARATLLEHIRKEKTRKFVFRRVDELFNLVKEQIKPNAK